MQSRRIIWAASAVLLTWQVHGQAPAPPPAGATVVRTVQAIQFSGNTRLSTENLLAGIGLKVGDLNTREAVGGAMERIVQLYRQAGSDLALMVDISLPDNSHTIVKFLIDESGTGGNKGAAPRAGGNAPPAGGGAPPGSGAPPAAVAAPSLKPQVVGNPGQAGKGPVIEVIDFSGHRRLSAESLAAVVQLKTGTPLSAAVIYPELDRITAAYASLGGAYVQPSIVELGVNRVHVTFQVHEGVVPEEGPEAAPMSATMQNFLGNTLVCAAAQTGNDLCKLWLDRDGTFLIFDQNGAYTGKWVAGKTRADGRTPICRYWDLSQFELPAELRAPMGPVAAPATGPAAAPPAVAATAPPTAPMARGARICESRNFRTVCSAYPDVTQLSPELQRKARRTRLEMNHEEGSCYAHGPHALGEAWFEWDNHSPGQLGLDREILLRGQQ